MSFLEKALEIEFDDQIAYELATLLYDREEYQRALIYFKQIDTLSPDFEGYEYGYALALQAENDRETALAIAEQGIQKNPFDAYPPSSFPVGLRVAPARKRQKTIC